MRRLPGFMVLLISLFTLNLFRANYELGLAMENMQRAVQRRDLVALINLQMDRKDRELKILFDRRNPQAQPADQVTGLKEESSDVADRTRQLEDLSPEGNRTRVQEFLFRRPSKILDSQL